MSIASLQPRAHFQQSARNNQNQKPALAKQIAAQPLRFGNGNDGFQFTSDNCAPTMPAYLKAILDANRYDDTYGHDQTQSPAIEKRFEALLGQGTKIFFANNGTVANTGLLKNVMNATDAVVSTDVAHMSSRSGGSIEANIGAKVMTVKHENGKLTVEALDRLIHPPEGKKNFTKVQQPKVISISQPTELGTVYTQAEIQALAKYAHQNGMLLHMDGARLLNAAASELFKPFKNPLRAMTTDAGVDMVYMGGTKNNMDTVETAIYTPAFFEHYPKMLMKSLFKLEQGQLRLNRDKGNAFDRMAEVHWKQLGTLNAKTAKNTAAQLQVALNDQYGIQTANHANQMALELAGRLKRIGLVKEKPETNVVILSMPLAMAKIVAADNHYKRLKIMALDPEVAGHGLMRLNTNGLTTLQDIDNAVDYFQSLQRRYQPASRL